MVRGRGPQWEGGGAPGGEGEVPPVGRGGAPGGEGEVPPVGRGRCLQWGGGGVSFQVVHVLLFCLQVVHVLLFPGGPCSTSASCS